MTPSFTTDVLISGAGAAGLTLAIDLARRKVPFRLIDKADEPFRGSRGKGIQPRSLEIFEDLGVLNRMLAIGGPYPPQRKYRADGSFDEEPSTVVADPSPSEPYAQPLMLPQYLTEGILRDRLAEFGRAPVYASTLEAFEQDADGVSATVATPCGHENIRARYLVGTDGGRSFVRKALDIGFPGESLNFRALVADLTLSGLNRDAWHRWQSNTPEQISLCPLQGTDLFQLQMPIPSEGEFDLSLDGLAAIVHARTNRRDIVLHAVHWCSDYSMSSRLAERYRVGRVFIAGDAAHVHPPTGGQGLNTSMQDAYNLGWKLAAALNGAPDSLLDSYEAERREVAANMLGLATRLLDAARQRGDLTRGRDTQQLDIGYANSILAWDERPTAATLHAGDRAPDAPARSADGQPTRLFSLYAGPQWTLLAYEAEIPAGISFGPELRLVRIGETGDVHDEGDHIRNAYGFTRGELMLVRPDGYIGVIVQDDQERTLRAYMKDVGLDCTI